jgi:glycosyltransferase involved in cell wall biosynthesis
LNILYHIPELSQESGGIRQYAAALLKILAKDTGPRRYFVLHNSADPLIMSILRENPHLTHIPPSIGRERKWERLANRLMRLADFVRRTESGKRLRAWSYIDRLCGRYKIDLVHCPYQFVAFTRRKKIFTLHDVQELYFPQFFDARTRAVRAASWVDFLERADAAVVSFAHVKQDLLRFFDCPPERVHVCLLDMQEMWFDRFLPQNATPPAVLQAALGIPADFLLYPANTWEHKNHLGLLRALALLRDERNLRVNLVCTGHQNAHFQTIRQEIERLQLGPQVFFVGVQDELTLYSLYRSAIGTAVPTFYEAGSFPLIESILLDVPVVCSNVTSLPETIGDPAFTFDPRDTAEMAEKIERLWSDPLFREKSRRNNHLRAPALRDNGALEKITAAYAAVLQPTP